jgi:16S rRNA (uracil1498-N3)-methyltransferase
VTLTGDEARHAIAVLRVGSDDRIEVTDGAGNQFSVVVTRTRSRELTGLVVNRRRNVGEPLVSLTLAQAILRSERMDWVIEKGTELGATRIIPMVTKHTEAAAVTLGERRRRRWQRLAISALKQSGRSVLTEIAAPIALSDVLATAGAYDLVVIAAEDERIGSVGGALASRKRAPRSVLGLVGPEGGFSPEEIAASRAVGAITVSLGIRRLRAETAGVVLAALLMDHLGELGQSPRAHV